MLKNIFQILAKKQDAGFMGGYLPPALQVNKAESPAPVIPCEYMCTEYGNALRFVHYYANNTFYLHDKKQWFIWTGKCWQPDNQNQVTSLALEAIKRIKDVEIPSISDALVKAKLKIWLERSMSRGKINNMLKLAEDLLTPQSPLDNHAFLLNAQNGTIDLKTGELLDHEREHYLTKLANVAYDPDAECPKWMEYLNRAFEGNQELIDYYQKALGYALSADVSEKCFFIFWGPSGNNGKTMTINVMRGILGHGYCVQVASETLMSKKAAFIRSDIARLKGYRFAAASETDQQYKFNEALIKLLTGGDAITARKLYENDMEFTPEMKLFIATNPLPVFNTEDQALMDRVVIIPFMVSIPREEQDKNLTEDLINEEGPGILSWAVQGSVIRMQDGLGRIPVNQTTIREVSPVPTVREFIESVCIMNDNGSTKTGQLYDAYVKYQTGIDTSSTSISIKEFGTQLTNNGIVSVHGRDGNYRQGISLR